MKQIAVWYSGWGEDWPLGRLADDGRTTLFEYSPAALAQGLELSPLNLPLREAAYGGFPPFQDRLPGLLADSLPDGWGLLLMDRLFRREGWAPPGPLERLAFIGERAMGALRFAPESAPAAADPRWDLLALARQTQRVIAGEARAALRELAVVGGSPQGARPKALVQYDPATGSLSTQTGAPGEPWLVKFPGPGEHKEACTIEQLYAELARDCGLDVPASACFDLAPKLAAFGTARFDRHAGLRVPVHSLAGLLQVDFRAPGALDYAALLRATDFLTRDRREVGKAFARAVFNVVFHNRDDHPKNFAWRLGRDRRWRLAPAYDLTFSDGPAGEHSMDIGGKGHSIHAADLVKLAKTADIPAQEATAVIERTASVAGTLPERAAQLPIRRATRNRLAATVQACRAALSA